MTQNAKHRRPKPEGRPKNIPEAPPPISGLNPAQQWLYEHNMGDDAESIEQLGTPLSVQELFAKFEKTPDEVTVMDLFSLSDLTRSDVEFVWSRWPKLPVALRISVIEQVVETAQDELQLAPSDFLRIALRDENATIRRLAVEGLWEDESEDLIGPYIQMLQRDPDAEVQAAAAAALGSYIYLGELEELAPALAMRVQQSLFEALEDESQPLLVRCRALESVAFSSDEGLRQLIEEAYYSPYEELRLSSLRAMGRSYDLHWRKMAQTELQNPDPAMRAEAAIACGELENKAAVTELIGLLADEEQTVRLSSIYALGRIGGKQARTALRHVAAGSESEEAQAAEEALDEMLFLSEVAAMVEADNDMAAAESELEDDDELDIEDELSADNETLWDRWSEERDDELIEDELEDDEFENDDDDDWDGFDLEDENPEDNIDDDLEDE
ncbi:MAG: HEAT repeat domain-containing protein [Caldilineaceae bacterium]